MESRFNRATLIAAVAAGICLLTALLAATFTLNANAAGASEDFSGSTFSVDDTEALAGATIKYTVVVSNSGDAAANTVTVTGTIPTGASYVVGSLSDTPSMDAATISSNPSAQQIVWEAVISAGGYATLSYEAEIAAGTAISTELDASVSIVSANSSFSDDVTTTVVEETDTFIYLPVVFRNAEPPVASVSSVSADGSVYKWTVSWNQVIAGGNYQIEESNDPSFATILSSSTLTGLSKQFTHAPGFSNQFFYRVRYASGAGSDWSGTVDAIGAYRDDFDNNSSGWIKVREDLDDVENVLSYTNAAFEEMLTNNENVLKQHVRGQWDYSIVSSLKPVPKGDYVLESRIIYSGAGNLNTYGFIVGADWNGLQCPTAAFIPDPNPQAPSRAADALFNPDELEESHHTGTDGDANRADMDIDNCFNHYYRIYMLWFGPDNLYKLAIKRINYHESPKNSGRGDAFVEFRDIPISDQNGWNEWRLEVLRSTGSFNFFSGTTLVASWQDTVFINESYWGLWASTDEYPGSDPLYDYVTVKPLP